MPLKEGLKFWIGLPVSMSGICSEGGIKRKSTKSFSVFLAYAFVLTDPMLPSSCYSPFGFHFSTENFLSCYRFPFLNYKTNIHDLDTLFQIFMASVLHRFRT